jgi:hypothetical protein
MWEQIDQEDRRVLKPIARVMAQDFLQAQLNGIEAKIRAQESSLERHYDPQDEARRGVEQMLLVYAQEKEIVEALMHDCLEDILPDAFHRRMLENERALSAARAGRLPAYSAESGYWQLRREAEMLKDLLRRWNRLFRSADDQEG